MSDVGEKLRASRAAHERKRRSTGRNDAGGVLAEAPDYPKAEAHLAEALRLRLEAHDLDPDHTDPEWARDVVSHDDLVAFFRSYPLIP